MFDGLDPQVQGAFVVIGKHQHRLLQNHRPMINLLVDEVDGCPRDLDPPVQRITHSVGAGERRKQRGVHVQDSLIEGTHELGSEDPHVTGKEDELDPLSFEHPREPTVPVSPSSVVVGVHRHRLDVPGSCPLQRNSPRLIRHDHLDPGTDERIVQERLKVRAGARGEHRDPRIH